MQPLSKLALLLTIFIISSCSKIAYLHVPLSIEESIDHRNIHVDKKQGRSQDFDYIYREGGYYVAYTHRDTIRLIQSDINAIYLNLDKINTAQLELSNKAIVKGFLLDVNDSAVVLAFDDQKVPYIAYSVNEIENINIRINGSIRNSYLAGTGSGIAIGLIISSIIVANDEFFESGSIYASVTGFFGIIGSLVGLFVSKSKGKEFFEIGCDLRTYKLHKSALFELSHRGLQSADYRSIYAK